MKNILHTVVIFCILLLAISCGSSSNTIQSHNLKDKVKIKTLERFLKLKSPVRRAEFFIYDVNLNNRSIPGPTDRLFQIYLEVLPEHIPSWIADDQGNKTTISYSFEWLRSKDIVDATTYAQLTELHFRTFYHKEPGYMKTMWIHEAKGIVILQYIQD